MFQARQGDIFFEEVNENEIDKKEFEPKEGNILAYGEVTGHCHQIDAPKQNFTLLKNRIGHLLAKSIVQDLPVVHDEHGTLQLPKNKMIKITRQREYDPLVAEKERLVRD